MRHTFSLNHLLNKFGLFALKCFQPVMQYWLLEYLQIHKRVNANLLKPNKRTADVNNEISWKSSFYIIWTWTEFNLANTEHCFTSTWAIHLQIFKCVCCQCLEANLWVLCWNTFNYWRLAHAVMINLNYLIVALKSVFGRVGLDWICELSNKMQIFISASVFDNLFPAYP